PVSASDAPGVPLAESPPASLVEIASTAASRLTSSGASSRRNQYQKAPPPTTSRATTALTPIIQVLRLTNALLLHGPVALIAAMSSCLSTTGQEAAYGGLLSHTLEPAKN